MNFYFFFFLLLLSGVTGIPLLTGFSSDASQYVSPAIAWGIAAIHAGCGFLLNTWAMRLSNVMFFRVVFGGIGIRMLVVAIAIVLLYPLIRRDMITFMLSLALFYFLFQGAEIVFLLGLLRRKKQENN